MERLYDTDSYVKEFEAVVLSCEQTAESCWNVVLDRTAFFPEGGGQTGDTGWLDGIEVTDTQEKEGAVCHLCKAPLEAGSRVLGRLDFAKRFDKMQQHTGEHILCGIAHRLHGYENVGFHLGDEFTTMDLDGELSEEQVRALETSANEAVFANHPVVIKMPSREELSKMEYRSKIEIEGQVRIIEIPGVDSCACCAPHVWTTAEVGLIKILSCERHRGGSRLTILCGMRALKDYQKKQELTGQISAALSAKPDRIAEAVTHLQEQQQTLREQFHQIQARYLQGKLENVRPEDPCVCIFEEGFDPIAMRNFVNAAMERCDGICGAFRGNDRDGYQYVIGSRTVDMREAAGALREQFGGKGGGKPQMVQGSVGGSAEKIYEFFINFSDAHCKKTV